MTIVGTNQDGMDISIQFQCQMELYRVESVDNTG
jgi:hypothetical protein